MAGTYRDRVVTSKQRRLVLDTTRSLPPRIINAHVSGSVRSPGQATWFDPLYSEPHDLTSR